MGLPHRLYVDLHVKVFQFGVAGDTLSDWADGVEQPTGCFLLIFRYEGARVFDLSVEPNELKLLQKGL
jgi:hypothetical protein